MDDEHKPMTRDEMRDKVRAQYHTARRLGWDEIAMIFLKIAEDWKLLD